MNNIGEKMWDDTEHSTRNCFNCKVGVGGIVHCDYKPLEYEGGAKMREKAVSRQGRLFACCKGCNNADWNWEG